MKTNCQDTSKSLGHHSAEHSTHRILFCMSMQTLESASKRFALTSGVLAIRCPTAASMEQFFTTSTCATKRPQLGAHTGL